MNDADQIIQTCFALALIWAVWHYGWKILILDYFRQSLFGIRDDLFEMARRSEHGLSFKDPAYIELRNALNSRIRYAHQITFSHIAITYILGWLTGSRINEAVKNYVPKFDTEINAVENPDLKKRLRGIRFRASVVLFVHLLLTSPTFLFLMFTSCTTAFIGFICKHGIKTVKKAFVDVGDREVEYTAQVISFQSDALQCENLQLAIG